MKKIYSLLLLLTTCMVCALQAKADEPAFYLTFNIDDVDRVEVKVDWNAVEGLTNGDNSVGITSTYPTVQINAKDGYILNNVSLDGVNQTIYSLTSCYLYPNASNKNITVTSGELELDGVLHVNVDNPEAVTFTFPNRNSYYELSAGEQDVPFSTEYDKTISITPSDYSKPLYKVTQNGDEVAAQYSSYTLIPHDNDNIDIQANYPDIDCQISISVTEGAEDCIKSVTVDGNAIENPLEGFSAKAGTNLSITYNYSDYKVESLLINGNPEQYLYGSYSTIVTGDLNIEFNAYPYGKLTATIDIDDPSRIIFYRGYPYQNDVISLNPGENEIEVSENNPYISWSVQSGCYLTEFTDGENDFTNNSSLTVTEGQRFTVRTAEIVRDKTVVIYIDDITAAQYGASVTRSSDHSYIEVASGYNVVSFYEGDIPFSINAYGAPITKLYLNGEEVEPAFSGATYFYVTPADGDVVMLYLAAEPSTHNVTFDITAESTEVNVVANFITTVDDFTTPLSVLTGTLVSIQPENGDAVDVTVDGVLANPGEDGSYDLTITSDTTVKVSDKVPDGIGNVTAGGNDTADVYNLQGVLVRKNATASGISTLPAGIYISGGKKVVVK